MARPCTECSVATCRRHGRHRRTRTDTTIPETIHLCREHARIFDEGTDYMATDKNMGTTDSTSAEIDLESLGGFRRRVIEAIATVDAEDMAVAYADDDEVVRHIERLRDGVESGEAAKENLRLGHIAIDARFRVGMVHGDMASRIAVIARQGVDDREYLHKARLAIKAAHDALTEVMPCSTVPDCDTVEARILYAASAWKSEREEASHLAQLCQDAHDVLHELGVPGEDADGRGKPADRIRLMVGAQQALVRSVLDALKAAHDALNDAHVETRSDGAILDPAERIQLLVADSVALLARSAAAEVDRDDLRKRKGAMHAKALERRRQVEDLTNEVGRLEAEVQQLRARVGTIAHLLDTGKMDPDGIEYNLQHIHLAHRVARAGRVTDSSVTYDAPDYRDNVPEWILNPNAGRHDGPDPFDLGGDDNDYESALTNFVSDCDGSAQPAATDVPPQTHETPQTPQAGTMGQTPEPLSWRLVGQREEALLNRKGAGTEAGRVLWGTIAARLHRLGRLTEDAESIDEQWGL